MHSPFRPCIYPLIFLLFYGLPCAVTQAENTYNVDDNVVITTEAGIELSMLTVMPAHMQGPLPIALNFTIYANEDRQKDIQWATKAAKRGYVGVMAYARGKHLSRSQIQPYETEVEDVNTVIEWLSRQPWSNGQIGMYGGSYNGFAQWAAAKQLHPALKTIVPYVAAIPGHGLPMENNVFINANYGWPFHVTNNRYKDETIYQQNARWQAMQHKWFHSGKPYRQLDSFDKRPNPWLQSWLKHPDYDAYWQAMVPYKEDYRQIAIPVLSITGYYDDGQISALHYLNEHYAQRPDAQHYLVIGPYDHLSAQHGADDTLRDMPVDPVARINVHQLTFDWLDHVLKGKPKPALLEDKINYQLMGSNAWRHASSLPSLNQQTINFYMHKMGGDDVGTLSLTKPKNPGFSRLEIDLADREQENSYYPWPIITDSLPEQQALVFATEPLRQAIELSGQPSFSLEIKTNKRDFDLSVVLYEQRADGQFHHLGFYLGRASYTDDMSKRHLLTPGELHTLHITRTRMVSKLIARGSKLILVAAVNKNRFAQVNYGTGKAVSDESVADAGAPLVLEWSNNSVLHLPVQNAGM